MSGLAFFGWLVFASTVGVILGWYYRGKTMPPRPHKHNWRFEHYNDGVARYCRDCHEAGWSAYRKVGSNQQEGS